MLEKLNSIQGKLSSKINILLRNHDKARLLSIDASSEASSEAYSTLQNIQKSHLEELIPGFWSNSEMGKYDRYTRETTLFFSDSKQHLTQILRQRLQAIGHLQSQIATLPTTLNSLSSAIAAQSEAFLQILHVHRMAPAWAALLFEISRRREFARLFIQKAKDMADVLAGFRTLEDKRRENFRVEILQYLPCPIPGLDDRPPYCEISVSNTKGSLPELDKKDLDAFEECIKNIKEKLPENSSAVESLSRLQTTVAKMNTQIKTLPSEFDRILAKSNHAFT
jgi:hypothetical protein